MNIELAGVFYWTADSTRTGKHMNKELAGVFLLDCEQYKDWQTHEQRTSWGFFYWTVNSTRTGKHMNIELAGVFLLD